eukprot:GEMP01016464.1.p1 GENE.GEMP01016464.1~~GEMP01016464.1.p1  ORF type:complete len:409 (+),score=93.66 GEMP01016464.1:200-1426(+)
MPLCLAKKNVGFKLRVCLEDGQCTKLTVKDGTKCLKEFIDDELQNEWPTVNFRNLQLYGAGQRLDDELKITALPAEMMALSCPDPPQWSIPGPGAHLPLQPFRDYTVIRHVLCISNDAEGDRMLCPGCSVRIEETLGDSVRVTTTRYHKRNYGGVIVLPPEPILGLEDLPLSLRANCTFILQYPVEILCANAWRQRMRLNAGDTIKIAMDSDFVHRVFPDDALLIVQREVGDVQHSGTIKLMYNRVCCIRPAANMEDAQMGRWYFHCSRAIRSFGDFNWVVEHDPIVVTASRTTLGTSVLALDGVLRLAPKKSELLCVKTSFALRSLLALQDHPRVQHKCHLASVSVEMTSLRAHWLRGIQASLGMVATKDNVQIFAEFAPAVSRSKPILKVAARVKMSPISVVAALL